MANATTTQSFIDGPRNLVIKVTGILDTSDISPAIVVVDPNTGQFPAAKCRLDRVNYAISDGLQVRLYWDATVPTLINVLSGRGRIDAYEFGGELNNAASPTGNITLATEGFATGVISAFTLLLEMVKQP